MKTVIVNENDACQRLDKFLSKYFKTMPKSLIYKGIRKKRIKVNGKKSEIDYILTNGDKIDLYINDEFFEVPDERVSFLKVEKPNLDIVYEDDDLMIINKPAGMVVHPGCGNYSGTLVNAIAWHLRDNPNYDPNDPSVGLVHRIDKDTSGLLVVAKTPDAKTSLGMQFFNKTTKRHYNALVWGSLKDDTGTIRSQIARNPHDRLQMAVFTDPAIGKHAVTHYRVLERIGYVTLVECILETGRTHQIRVHMKHLGHPLFNDERYGGSEILKGTTSGTYRKFVANCFDTCPRQALHARTLGFVHPRTGQEMFFTSELPTDMTALIDRWHTYVAGKSEN